MSHYSVNHYSVEAVLNWIRSGEIAIPEMQRPFVWDSSQVRDLLDSLYKGYPIGYLITWRNPDVQLKDGSISKGKKIVIDGQQRLTAFMTALSGMCVLDDDYHKQRYRIAFNPLDQTFMVCNPAIEKDSRYIDDVSVLFTGKKDLFKIMSDYAQANNVSMEQIYPALNTLQNLVQNSLGVIELSDDLDLNAVTEIFKRINAKGTTLSQADFVMSTISANEEYRGNTIRKIIDHFCRLNKRPADLEALIEIDQNFAESKEFEALKWIAKKSNAVYVPSYGDVLHVAFISRFQRARLSDLVAKLGGRDFDTRTNNEMIAQDSYQKLYAGVMDFVNQTNFERYVMILKSMGFINEKTRPSSGVLNFCYALFLYLRQQKVDSAVVETVVKKWLILSILRRRYSGSSETAMAEDISRFKNSDPLTIVKRTEGTTLSESFWTYALPEQLTVSSPNSSVYKLYLATQVWAADKGFLSHSITIRSLIENHGDVHHLFPKKYLIRSGISEKKRYNQVANYAFTQQEVNLWIKDEAPNVYLSRVVEQIENGQIPAGGITSLGELHQNMTANCIPDSFMTDTAADYETFLQERRQLMANKIHQYYESI